MMANELSAGSMLDLISDAEVIRDRIKDHIFGEKLKMMEEGVRYYLGQHDILKRTMTYMQGETKVLDLSRSNMKVVNPFHRLLVMQKTNYIVGSPISFTAPDPQYEGYINTYLGYTFDSIAPEWIVGASNKGVEWLHVYIDSKGQFRYTIADAEGIIPIYDNQYADELVYIIRFYRIPVVHRRGKDFVYKVELWDKEKVTFYMEQEDGTYKLDDTEPLNPRYHWYYKDILGGQEVGRTPQSWGRVPFIRLRNNREELSDLSPIKGLIDAYDIVASDFVNDLVDIQNFITVLKGYEGESLDEFMKNLKLYKAIKIREGGGVDFKNADIPKEAREAILKQLEENIYSFGLGFNPNTDKFGNAPSGIALKNLYQGLDMKARSIISEMTASVKELLWFVTRYINAKYNTNYDHEDVTISFRKNMIINESEIIQNLNNSVGILSLETILANHPYVQDVAEEIQRRNNNVQSGDTNIAQT